MKQRLGAPNDCICLDSVFRSYKSSRPIISGFSYKFPRGKVVAILGPSGCGKSSLLRLIAGVDLPDRGAVKIWGRTAREELREGRLSLLSADSSLLPWRDVAANIRLPLDLLGIDDKTHTRCAAMISRMRLSKLEGRRPHELSDGQRQRLRLAQALITEPDLLLFDEPFSSLDEGLRHILTQEIKHYLDDSIRTRTALLVTHSALDAAELADLVLIVDGDPLRVHAEITMEVPRQVRAPNIHKDWLIEKQTEIIAHLCRLAGTDMRNV